MTRSLLSSLTCLSRHRSRVRVAWLGLWALVFQQLALVTYACPLQQPAAPTEQVMAGCESMTNLDPTAPILCQQHCQRDHVTTPDLKTLQVASLAPLPLMFGLIDTRLPPVEARHYRDVPVCLSDPPPAQRFCSLQI